MSTRAAIGASCPACGSAASTPVLAFAHAVPVLCNAFGDTRERALSAPKGRIDLAVCGACTLLWNTAFEPGLADYETNYDNSLHFSGVFAAYAEALAQRLSETYQLNGRTVVEVGCGDGSFLDRLCELGNSTGVGFDPSFAQKAHQEFRSPKVSVVSRLFAPNDGDGASLIVARHVLEHVASPLEFLRLLRGDARTDQPAAIYLEVPSADYMVREHAYWDLIYEHPTYFTRAALAAVVAATGWHATGGGESFHDQYLWIEARSAAGVAAQAISHVSVEATIAAAERFGRAFERQLGDVDALVRSRAANGNVVLWGAGSKGVTLLNLLPSRDQITCAIDINPAKQGAFVPGTGHPVIAPADLMKVAPTTVLLMNGAYLDEVQRAVTEMGCSASVELMPAALSGIAYSAAGPFPGSGTNGAQLALTPDC